MTKILAADDSSSTLSSLKCTLQAKLVICNSEGVQVLLIYHEVMEESYCCFSPGADFFLLCRNLMFH